MSSQEEDESVVDLTEINAAQLKRLYSQLKQISEEGELLPSAPTNHLRDGLVLTYERLQDLSASIQKGPRSTEASRLCSEWHLSLSHIERQMHLSGKKEALELLLDVVWAEGGSVAFSLVPLFKELGVSMEVVEVVEELAAATAQLGVRQLLRDTFIEPSALQLVVTALGMKAAASPLFRQLVDKSDELAFVDGAHLDDDEGLAAFDAAFDEMQLELETEHVSIKQGLEAVSEEADKINEEFAQLDGILADLREQMQTRVDDQKQAIAAAPVSVTDDSTAVVCELVPSKYRQRAEELVAAAAAPEVEALDDSATTVGRPRQHINPPERLPEQLDTNDACFIDANGTGRYIAATFLSQTESKSQVRILGYGNSLIEVPNEWVAFEWRAEWSLAVGTRVIAQSPTKQWHAAIIGESASFLSNDQYLVFYDDGTAAYVSRGDLRLTVVQCKVNGLPTLRRNWTLIAKANVGHRTFMMYYLQHYPAWKMVTLRKAGEKICVERGGVWFRATVMAIDRRLVQLRFPVSPPVTEWIYRGSARFRVLKDAERSAGSAAAADGNRRVIARRSTAHRQHTEMASELTSADDRLRANAAARDDRPQTARKTFSHRRWDTFDEMDLEARRRPQQRAQPKESMRLVEEPLPRISHQVFVDHACSRRCVRGSSEANATERFIGKSPFLIPLLIGWQRQIANPIDRRLKSRQSQVYYVAPCGRRLRSMKELTRYLKMTSSHLTVDLFAFDVELRPCARAEAKVPLLMDDYSQGREDVPITVVNAFSDERPVVVNYSKRRFAASSEVRLTTGSNFCSGCDCKDDCVNSAACQCQLLLRDELKRLHKGLRPKIRGYSYRRLTENMLVGLFECNDNCSCSRRSCFNRVVQQPLKVPLQLFMTPARGKGWGVRALVDLPAGYFVCVYSGAILTDQMAEQLGREVGDEYFADLNLIATISAEKYDMGVTARDDWIDLDESGAEADVVVASDSDSDDSRPRRVSSGDDDVDSTYGGSDGDGDGDSGGAEANGTRKSSRTAKRRKDDQVLIVSTEGSRHESAGSTASSVSPVHESAAAAAAAKELDGEADESRPRFSMRRYFGDDQLFIIDAKTKGNIGRFLNHSCDANVFVQNVMVDTHDLRLPWCAFFTLRHVPAGEELCWNYGYDLTQEYTRSIACLCGAHNCRGRLL